MKSFFQKLFGIEKVNVFPNPSSKGKFVNLMLKDSGEFAVHLIDGKSQFFHKQKFTVKDSQEVKLFTIPNEVKNGLYYLRVINEQTSKSFIKPILIV